MIYAELDNDIEDLKYQYLSDYDGFGKEQVEELEKNKKRLIKIIEKNLKVLDDYKPMIENHSRKEISLSEISSEKLKNFCISFNRSTARSNLNIVRFINCEPNVVAPLNAPLNKIGKAHIKLNIIETVIEDIELEGSFSLKQEFDTVPDACRYYEKELGEEITRDRLKSQIKKFAVFYENGEKVEWSTINGRINTWVHDEGKKPNKQKIPHK
ncbi:hypothetical protein [Rhodohalobacter sulfatireducens]|nr:hypothetical protein [Rhodohalobacter sulfatireducens]